MTTVITFLLVISLVTSELTVLTEADFTHGIPLAELYRNEQHIGHVTKLWAEILKADHRQELWHVTTRITLVMDLPETAEKEEMFRRIEQSSTVRSYGTS